jgi:hypothetical protein
MTSLSLRGAYSMDATKRAASGAQNGRDQEEADFERGAEGRTDREWGQRKQRGRGRTDDLLDGLLQVSLIVADLGLH